MELLIISGITVLIFVLLYAVHLFVQTYKDEERLIRGDHKSIAERYESYQETSKLFNIKK